MRRNRYLIGGVDSEVTIACPNPECDFTYTGTGRYERDTGCLDVQDVIDEVGDCEYCGGDMSEAECV